MRLPAQVERLALIRQCRNLYMTLDEVRALIRLRAVPAQDCGEINALLDEHIGHDAGRIRELGALEKDLKALRARCASPHAVADCGILDRFDRAAATGPATARPEAVAVRAGRATSDERERASRSGGAVVICITHQSLMGAARTLWPLHSRDMHRWLAVLLLLLLPIQFSWAAVANYCGHETGAAADHVGHHEHASHNHGAKVADPGDSDKTDVPAPGASSFDCGHCHGYYVGMLCTPSSREPRLPGDAPPSLGDAILAEHVPAQPDRPQWAPLA
jgi:hypothetical protein